jgi:hypothetical protein
MLCRLIIFVLSGLRAHKEKNKQTGCAAEGPSVLVNAAVQHLWVLL